jgi:acyl-[acyl-carrier-protein] desaturase
MQQFPALHPDLEKQFYQLYCDFFDKAEKRRRWSLREDIPWDQCNTGLNPALADVVESFCAVELYLPDYVWKLISRYRSSRAWSWFYANWGYEESKHSRALEDWLLRSRLRTDEQVADLQGKVFSKEWIMPEDHPVGAFSYAMVQEMATGLNYRRLRRHVDQQGDPALSKLLGYLSVDEQAHHSFFLRAIRLYLEFDREDTLRHLHRVMHTFAMPAIYELADGQKRVNEIKALKIFDDFIYMQEVYMPILDALGISRKEFKRCA